LAGQAIRTVLGVQNLTILKKLAVTCTREVCEPKTFLFGIAILQASKFICALFQQLIF
jgi:hypothetical protein